MLTDETGGNGAERCLMENQIASDFDSVSSDFMALYKCCYYYYYYFSGLSARPLKQNQWCN